MSAPGSEDSVGFDGTRSPYLDIWILSWQESACTKKSTQDVCTSYGFYGGLVSLVFQNIKGFFKCMFSIHCLWAIFIVFVFW